MADHVDALYGLPPAEFTAARNALVKQLKAAGATDEAAQVAALRKPPTSAWALNRVARDRPDLVDAALEAGDRLREATEEALAGDASGLRDASAAQRAAAGDLVEAASALAGSGGAAGAGRMATTVHAAALDPDVADQLRRGVLAADHDRSGLGLGGGLGGLGGFGAAPAPSGPPKLRVLQGGRSDGPSSSQERAARKEAAAAEAAAQAERLRRRNELRTLRKRAADLAGRAEIATREAARLAGDADRLEADANRARLLAIDAEATAEAARGAHADAEAEVARAEADED